MKSILAVLSVVFSLALSGCSTVKTRIDEKSTVFASLDPATQARLKQGIVDIGYTEDMVYIAVGKPDQIKDKSSSKGRETTWIYSEYWQEYEGSHVAGYHREVFFDRRTKAWRLYYEPIRADVYSGRSREKIRISFEDGQVTAIETAKD